VQSARRHRDSTSKGTTQRAAMMAEAGVSAPGPGQRGGLGGDSAGHRAGVESRVGAWGGGLQAVNMAARLMLDERHVLAAPAKGIISGRRPATLLRWGQAGAWCCAAAACSMIHEPIARVCGRGGAGAGSRMRRQQHAAPARSGAMGRGCGWRSSFGEWKSGKQGGRCATT
jgi:hypothetical protein